MSYHPINEGIIPASVGMKNRTKVTDLENKWFINNGFKKVAATNGMFFGFQTIADSYGLDYRDSGFIMGDTTMNDVWNELIYQDGKLIIDEIVAADIPKKYPRAAWVMGLSYTLILDGKIDIRKSQHFDHAKYPNPRVAYGQTADGTIITLVTDGRSANDKGLTAQQTAEVMLSLGCIVAVNADGGGSATLAAMRNGKFEVINDLAGSERAVAQGIVLYSRNNITIDYGKEAIKRKVGVDIGHSEDTYELTGGKGVKMPDGVAFEEFHFNVDIGRKLTKLLLDDGRFDVYLAQPLDHITPEVDINRRSNFYDDNACEFIFSIHGDAHSSTDANGKTAFYASSKGQAACQNWFNFTDVLVPELKSRAIHKCVKDTWISFGIVLNTNGVAMLAEHGFFTNPKDRANMMKEDFRTRCAYAAYYTYCDFFGFKAKFVYTEDKPIVTPEPVILVPDFKMETLKYLSDNGLINDYDQWSKKLDEKADNWLIFELIRRLHEKGETR
ncbi:MAG: phosphodiester glycosidase family protein [Vallitaleaceae bacterium]|nr:phosphodiester glycosidase family protein [Vallitaleaceae bacterium]